MAAAFGPQFQNSAYTFTVTGTTAGIYHVVVYSHSMLSNTWTSQAITLYIDMPTAGLVIDRQGSGTGAITGTNVSVSCVGGATTQGVPCVVTTPPALNATVTLTPAADSGSVFQGWSGACSGSSICQVTMAGPQYVSARFGKLTTTVTTNYYHTDVIGSVRALTSGTGAIVTRHDYQPFGEDTAPLSGDPKRFAGKDLDVETALQNFEARMYRNVWGRFMTVDPVGGTLTDPQSWNAYSYALNNPLRFVDPLGLKPRGNCEVINDRWVCHDPVIPAFPRPDPGDDCGGLGIPTGFRPAGDECDREDPPIGGGQQPAPGTPVVPTPTPPTPPTPTPPTPTPRSWRDRLNCASDFSNSNSLSAVAQAFLGVNNRFVDAMLGNDAAAVSDLATGRTSVLGTAWGFGEGEGAERLVKYVVFAPVGAPTAVLAENGAGTAYVKRFNQKVLVDFLGTAAAKFAGRATVLKLVYDAASYARGVAGCGG